MHFNKSVFTKLSSLLLVCLLSISTSYAEVDSSIVKTKDSRMYHYAYLNYQYGKFDKSEKYIDKAIRLNPITHYKILKAHILLRRSPEAVKDYVAGSGRDILNNIEGLAIYATALNELSQYHMAAKVYQVLTNREPDNGRWWVGLGLSHEYLDNTEESLRMYKAALKMPNTPTNIYNFAESRYKHISDLVARD